MPVTGYHIKTIMSKSLMTTINAPFANLLLTSQIHVHVHQRLTNKFSNDLSNLTFRVPVIKLCILKPLVLSRKVLVQGYFRLKG